MSESNNINKAVNKESSIQGGQKDQKIEYAWFVGSTDSKNNQYADQYINEGRWENRSTKLIKKVQSMKIGDRIVIKAPGRMKKDIPFNNYGQDVGFVYIKAIGTITENRGDGKNISVDWKKVDPPRIWYTHVGALRSTANMINSSASSNNANLLNFVFGNMKQDYSLCEKYYDEQRKKNSKSTNNNTTVNNSTDSNSLFDGFQSWLTTHNNPDYNGKYSYAGYAAGLKKLINFMYKKGIIESNELNELDVEKYKAYLSAYNESQEARDYDYKKISKKTGGAALSKYIHYIEYMIHPSFEWKTCITGGVNLVIYGTPGCGKSYHVDHTILGKNEEGKYAGVYKEENIIRTTFYQEYSYTDFVGQIVPEIEYQGENQSNVSYRFVPGPFTQALEIAIAHPTEKVALVVEELNRGNAPSIFGDLFQLLDRIEDEGNEYPVGTSEYGIVNSNIINYLKDNIHYSKKYHYLFDSDEIRLPANLSIFATMNTSDQNVFTLDTAFKRRWEFRKLKNEFKDHKYENYLIPGMGEEKITWRKFVKAINSFIINDREMMFSEDKQIGVYFVPKKMLMDPSKTYDEDETEKLIYKFAYKVFEYIWNDVAKFSRDKWFVGNIKSLDDLIEKFKSGETVFVDEIFQ